jgi:hypothetical protein
LKQTQEAPSRERFIEPAAGGDQEQDWIVCTIQNAAQHFATGLIHPLNVFNHDQGRPHPKQSGYGFDETLGVDVVADVVGHPRGSSGDCRSQPRRKRPKQLIQIAHEDSELLAALSIR